MEALTKPETNKRLQDPTPVYDMTLNRIPIQMMSVVVTLVSGKLSDFTTKDKSENTFIKYVRRLRDTTKLETFSQLTTLLRGLVRIK